MILAAAVSAVLAAKGLVESLAFSPDGQLLAAAEVNGVIVTNDEWAAAGGLRTIIDIRQVPGGAVVRTLRGHTDLVWSVSWSPDGAQLASGGRDNTVRLWRVSDGAAVASWSPPTSHSDGPYKGVMTVAFSPDGRMVAGAGVDEAWVWWVSDHRLLATRPVKESRVTWSSDGMLVTRGVNDAVELWRPDGSTVRVFADGDVGLCPLALHASAAFAECRRLGRIDVKALADGHLIRSLDPHPQGTWRVMFSVDGRLLISGGTDAEGGGGEIVWPISAVRIRRLSDGKLVARLACGEGFVYSLAESRDARWLAAGVAEKIHLWAMPK